MGCHPVEMLVPMLHLKNVGFDFLRPRESP